MTNKMTHAPATKMTKAQAKALAAVEVETALQKVGFKKVMILDLQDGAFTDHGVKVRPHTGGTGVVLKCVSKARLLKAMKMAGIEAPIKKGGKHWIADPMAAFEGTGMELVIKQ